MIKLSKRLLEIVNHLDFKEKVLDVGCDHGKLAIYLILNNHYNNINVSDNKLSALNQAIKNIEDYNLKDKITYHLGEGIEFIDNLDLDTLIISGLGTRTILKIINHKNLNKINKLVIQANNEHYLLREEIINLGFNLVKETVIKDSNHYYITMTFIRGKSNLTELEKEFGIHHNKDYLTNELLKYNKIINNPQVNAKAKNKFIEIINKLEKLINN